MEIEEEIKNLISEKYEGDYWDFKKCWYSEKVEMLFDIICYANNLANRDCYIIIGVDEEKGYGITDLSQDPNRKNQQNIIDYLKEIYFVGGIRPTVFVKSIVVLNQIIDIIVIKNTNSVPYMVAKDYSYIKKVELIEQQNGKKKQKIIIIKTGVVYTRIQDVNTSKEGVADIDKQEYLWKKRFGMNLTPLKRMFYYLTDYENWEEWNNEDSENEISSYYYKMFPEFTISITEDTKECGPESYSLLQCNTKMTNAAIELKYYGTVLSQYWIIYLDGGRGKILTPDQELFKENNDKMLVYRYFCRDSDHYNIYRWLSRDASYEHKIVLQKASEAIITFSNLREKYDFDEYIKSNMQKWEDLIEKCNFENKYSYLIDCIPKWLRARVVLRDMYENITAVEIYKQWIDNIYIG